MFKLEKANFRVLLGISLASFLGLLDLTIVSTALPAIQQEFHSSVFQLQWVTNSILLSLTTAMSILAKLADNYGRRRFLYLGLFLFGLSSIGIALAPHLSVLLGFRFMQGVAIALLYVTSLAIIPNAFPLEAQGKASGFLVGISSVGLALGPVFGGILVSTIGWRWIFWINPPLALICWICCLNTLQESKNRQKESMDWRGFLLLLVGIPSLILAIIESQRLGLWSWPVLSLFVIAIVCLLSLISHSKKQSFPIIQFSLLQHPLFIIGLIANISLAAFYAVDFFIIPLFLHDIKNYPANQIGLTLLPATLLVALFSLIAGRWVDKHGPKGSITLGLGLLLCSVVLQIQFNAHTFVALLFAAYCLFGIGWACILSPSLAAAMASVPRERSGVAAGMMGTSHNLGGAIGLAVGALIFTSRAKTHLQTAIQKIHLSTSGNWLNEVVTNTDQGINLLMQHTHFNPTIVNQLFRCAFLSGYAWSLGFLALLVCIVLGMIGLLRNSS